jgi:hypothetical protein
MVKKQERRIVVLTAGWVFVGVWHPATETTPAFLTEASNVREWGTKAGLGELALNGPTNSTVMDPCGILVLDNPRAIIFSHPCEW